MVDGRNRRSVPTTALPGTRGCTFESRRRYLHGDTACETVRAVSVTQGWIAWCGTASHATQERRCRAVHKRYRPRAVVDTSLEIPHTKHSSALRMHSRPPHIPSVNYCILEQRNIYSVAMAEPFVPRRYAFERYRWRLHGDPIRITVAIGGDMQR